MVKIKDIDDENLISRSFSNFFNAYSKSINKKYNRTGSLFQDRFKRRKIESEEYLREVIIYINLNAVYHKFTDKAESYKYSSYNTLFSNENTKLNRKEVIDLFNDRDNFLFCINDKKEIFDIKKFLE